MPMPAEQKTMPTAMALSAATDSTDRSMWPAMITSARPIDMTPRTVDCLDDVGEDADLEVVRDEDREDRQHREQDEPDEVVEHELEGPGAGVMLEKAVGRGGPSPR
jgi:hypothetical protein